MPIIKSLSPNRLDMREDVSTSCIQGVVADPRVKVLQTNSPITIDSWKLINDQLIPARPDIQIRIYGHSSKVCDLSTLEYIPNVENLSLDCLREVSHFESLDNLKKLKSLSVGIYHLDSFDFLNTLPASLETLSLGTTKSKKPKLDGLAKLLNLKELSVDEHNKNLEVIGELALLEKLVLRSVSQSNIDFIRKLSNLWSLDIKLGGLTDLGAIAGLGNLKYLELWQIKGLADLSVISSLKGLQYLFLHSLRNVKTFPDLSKLVKLRKIYMETMKGLEDLDGLFKAPGLEEFIHVSAQNMTPDQYQPLLTLSSLKKASFGFGSDKKNEQMKSMMEQHGIEQYSYEKFSFN